MLCSALLLYSTLLEPKPRMYRLTNRENASRRCGQLPRTGNRLLASGDGVPVVSPLSAEDVSGNMCLGPELTCKKRTDFCGHGIDRLGRMSYCSMIYIGYDLPFPSRIVTRPRLCPSRPRLACFDSRMWDKGFRRQFW